jgi:hypothetical protein
MLRRRFRDYSPPKVGKIQTPGRPNHGIRFSFNNKANTAFGFFNELIDLANLCFLNKFTSNKTHFALETLHDTHPPYAKSSMSLITDLWEECISCLPDGRLFSSAYFDIPFQRTTTTTASHPR